MSDRSPPLRRTVAVVVAGALAIAPAFVSSFGSGMVSASAGGTTIHKYSLAPHVQLTTYSFAVGPEQVRVIRITQGAASLSVVNAGPAFGVSARTSAIASKAYYDGIGYQPAIAATNGDFARSQMPVHMEEINGQMMTSGLQSSPKFAINADGSQAYMGRTKLSFTGIFNATPFNIDIWNAGIPTHDQIAGYSQVGGTVQLSPGTGSAKPSDPAYCAVRLVPSDVPQWSNHGKAGIERAYTVEAASTYPCPQTRMGLGTTPEAVVLAADASGVGATTLSALATCGCAVALTWRQEHWPGVIDSIGGSPMLVNNGVNVGPGYSYNDPSLYRSNPRTAIGFSASCSDTDPLTLCQIYLVTVDGRQDKWSPGWRLNQLGDFFVNTLHAQYALNLDGGGTTELWVHKRVKAFSPPCITSALSGCLVDKPAYQIERASIMALVALPGPDLGIPPSLR